MKIADIPGWLLPAPTSIWKEAVNGFGNLLPHISVNNWTCPRGFYHWLLDWDPYSDLAAFASKNAGSSLSTSHFITKCADYRIGSTACDLVRFRAYCRKSLSLRLFVFSLSRLLRMGGFRNTPPDMKHYMLMAGATKTQLFSKLEWPSCAACTFFRIEDCSYLQCHGGSHFRMAWSKKGNRRIYDACLLLISNRSCICCHFYDYGFEFVIFRIDNGGRKAAD